MPNCRECGSRLTRFDKDICPVCGCKNPLQGQENLTSDVTTEIESIPEEERNFKRLSRKTTLLLSLFLGWCGVPYFYLKYKKSGLIHLISMLILNLTVFLILLLAVNLSVWIPIVIVIGTCLVDDIVMGLIFYFKNDLKDGRGEYLE